MKLPLYQVDAFTARPFKGNPAAVCLLDAPRPDAWMQSLAQTSGYDFVSRYFAPHMGINEDPVTGSAHTHLVPYWASRLGCTTFSAYQASRRGGDLRLRLAGERVRIAGQAITIFSTEIAV